MSAKPTGRCAVWVWAKAEDTEGKPAFGAKPGPANRTVADNPATPARSARRLAAVAETLSFRAGGTLADMLIAPSCFVETCPFGAPLRSRWWPLPYSVLSAKLNFGNVGNFFFSVIFNKICVLDGTHDSGPLIKRASRASSATVRFPPSGLAGSALRVFRRRAIISSATTPPSSAAGGPNQSRLVLQFNGGLSRT